MLLNQDQLDEFHLRGFVVSPVPVLGEAEVDELLAELQLVVEGESAKKPVLNRTSSTGLRSTARPNRPRRKCGRSSISGRPVRSSSR